MTTPNIDAAREALRQAEAEVDRLRDKLRADLDDQDARGFSAEDRPQRLSWADGKAEAERRYPKGKATRDAPDTASDDRAAEGAASSGATAGRAEAARRRAGRPA